MPAEDDMPALKTEYEKAIADKGRTKKRLREMILRGAMNAQEKAIARAIRAARRAPGYHVVYCDGASLFIQAGELPRPPRCTIVALVQRNGAKVEIAFGEPSDG